MFRYIDELKDKYKGADIYVLGSGHSMSFFDRRFFDNKVVIGINWMHKFFKCEYSFVKDIVTEKGFFQWFDSANAHGSTLVTPERHEGVEHFFRTDKPYYVCKVGDWGGFADTNLVGTDRMMNAHLTVCTAIHFAYWLGASNIILGGIDCGLLDDKINMNGYYPPEFDSDYLKGVVSHPYNEVNLKRIRKKLLENDCRLVSINPFLNIGLEKHKYFKVPITELWAGEINE